jgi:hypothetical protein
MKALKEEVFDKLYLHEFFMINVAENVRRFELYLRDLPHRP